MTTLDLSPTPIARSRPERITVTDRTTAALVGLLFLVATITFGTGDALLGGVLDDSGYLPGASGHRGALAVFGVADVSQGPGMLALAPGGLFELLLPLWLLIKGFRSPVGD